MNDGTGVTNDRKQRRNETLARDHNDDDEKRPLLMNGVEEARDRVDDEYEGRRTQANWGQPEGTVPGPKEEELRDYPGTDVALYKPRSTSWLLSLGLSLLLSCATVVAVVLAASVSSQDGVPDEVNSNDDD
ncbi:hypothetical protein BKA70DRAFT_1564708 [Coprinopsis sp. MPI-PUGE-AT-0042]|nr:hypothetical protein BKA70DRAFT_1564708 [Coprinopsis sp. MPI-PUGE-AT-0042]